jgi:hypothetical protein
MLGNTREDLNLTLKHAYFYVDSVWRRMSVNWADENAKLAALADAALTSDDIQWLQARYGQLQEAWMECVDHQYLQTKAVGDMASVVPDDIQDLLKPDTRVQIAECLEKTIYLLSQHADSNAGNEHYYMAHLYFKSFTSKQYQSENVRSCPPPLVIDAVVTAADHFLAALDEAILGAQDPRQLFAMYSANQMMLQVVGTHLGGSEYAYYHILHRISYHYQSLRYRLAGPSVFVMQPFSVDKFQAFDIGISTCFTLLSELSKLGYMQDGRVTKPLALRWIRSCVVLMHADLARVESIIPEKNKSNAFYVEFTRRVADVWLLWRLVLEALEQVAFPYKAELSAVKAFDISALNKLHMSLLVDMEQQYVSEIRISKSAGVIPSTAIGRCLAQIDGWPSNVQGQHLYYQSVELVMRKYFSGMVYFHLLEVVDANIKNNKLDNQDVFGIFLSCINYYNEILATMQFIRYENTMAKAIKENAFFRIKSIGEKLAAMRDSYTTEKQMLALLMLVYMYGRRARLIAEDNKIPGFVRQCYQVECDYMSRLENSMLDQKSKVVIQHDALLATFFSVERKVEEEFLASVAHAKAYQLFAKLKIYTDKLDVGAALAIKHELSSFSYLGVTYIYLTNTRMVAYVLNISLMDYLDGEHSKFQREFKLGFQQALKYLKLAISFVTGTDQNSVVSSEVVHQMTELITQFMMTLKESARQLKRESKIDKFKLLIGELHQAITQLLDERVLFIGNIHKNLPPMRVTPPHCVPIFNALKQAWIDINKINADMAAVIAAEKSKPKESIEEMIKRFGLEDEKPQKNIPKKSNAVKNKPTSHPIAQENNGTTSAVMAALAVVAAPLPEPAAVVMAPPKPPKPPKPTPVIVVLSEPIYKQAGFHQKEKGTKNLEPIKNIALLNSLREKFKILPFGGVVRDLFAERPFSDIDLKVLASQEAISALLNELNLGFSVQGNGINKTIRVEVGEFKFDLVPIVSATIQLQAASALTQYQLLHQSLMTGDVTVNCIGYDMELDLFLAPKAECFRDLRLDTLQSIAMQPAEVWRTDTVKYFRLLSMYFSRETWVLEERTAKAVEQFNVCDNALSLRTNATQHAMAKMLSKFESQGSLAPIMMFLAARIKNSNKQPETSATSDKLISLFDSVSKEGDIHQRVIALPQSIRDVVEAEVNLKNGAGCYPLQVAIEKNDAALISFLMAGGADLRLVYPVVNHELAIADYRKLLHQQMSRLTRRS